MGGKQTNIKITLNEEVFLIYFFIKYPIPVLLEKNRFQADTWLYMKQVVHLFQRLCVAFMQNGFSHLSHR